MGDSASVLRRSALRIEQDRGRPLYLFSLEAADLSRIADVERLRRDPKGNLAGYQRGVISAHVRNITEYLDGNDVLFPNSIILALSHAKFQPIRGTDRKGDGAQLGVLEIPIPNTGSRKPGWIVDGQQRATAIARSSRRTLPIPVNAFIANNEKVHREQFLRVNSTRALPRGLVDELLPGVGGVLPAHLRPRQAPSFLCDRLNRDRKSPFYGIIRRPSLGKAGESAVVSDGPVIKMLENSVSSMSGALFPYWNVANGEIDEARMLKVLRQYWSAVRDTFPHAWGLPPAESRLMHGAGIVAMGHLMDRMFKEIDPDGARAELKVRRALKRVAPVCRWTEGTWPRIGLQWNQIQNVATHVRAITDVLAKAYLA